MTISVATLISDKCLLVIGLNLFMEEALATNVS